MGEAWKVLFNDRTSKDPDFTILWDGIQYYYVLPSFLLVEETTSYTWSESAILHVLAALTS